MHAVLGTHFGCLSRTGYVCLLVVNEREEGVVAVHLPTGPLKTWFGLLPKKREKREKERERQREPEKETEKEKEKKIERKREELRERER